MEPRGPEVRVFGRVLWLERVSGVFSDGPGECRNASTDRRGGAIFSDYFTRLKHGLHFFRLNGRIAGA
jgi:hypothetical protein